MKDNVQGQNYNSGAGKYTANGFQPARQSQSNNNSGCMSVIIIALVSIGSIVAMVVQYV